MVKVGDIIYVDSEFYLGHGEDDFVGGKAHVTKVFKQMSGGVMTTFIQIKKRPASSYNWGQYLAKEQESLKKEFGKQWAHPEPDMRPEFNTGF